MKKVLFLLCMLTVSAFSQEEADLYYGIQQNNNFFVKTGFGTGATYGGWWGLGTEVGYGIISLTAGVGKIYANTMVGKDKIDIGETGKFGWQVGLRLYFNAEENKFRPSLGVNFGKVYPYVINSEDGRIDGLYNAVTPCILFENKFGKKQKVGITYGIGPVIHKKIPEEDKEIIKIIEGDDLKINLSLVFGINFLII